MGDQIDRLTKIYFSQREQKMSSFWENLLIEISFNYVQKCLMPTIYWIACYLNGWPFNPYFIALWTLFLFLAFLADPADPDLSHWSHSIFPNVRVQVKFLVIMILFLWYKSEYSVAIFGAILVFVFQYKDMIELSLGTRKLLARYEQMRDFSDVRKIVRKMVSDEEYCQNSQVDVLLSVLKILAIQQTEQKVENIRLNAKLNEFQNNGGVLDLKKVANSGSEEKIGKYTKKMQELEQKIEERDKTVESLRDEITEKDVIIEEQSVQLAMDKDSPKERKKLEKQLSTSLSRT